MNICEHEIITEKDFWKLENISKEVYIYDYVLVITNTNNVNISRLENRLRFDEKEKSKSYRSETARTNFIISRSILNIVFKNILHMDIGDIKLLRDKNNKPYISNPNSVKFNISHTDGCVIAGFSKREIGVDIEKIDRVLKYRNIFKYCFNKAERENIGENIGLFFKYWTAKEACLKCEGSGFRRNPKEVEVVYMDDSIIKIIDKKNADMRISKPIIYSDKYVGAVSLDKETWIKSQEREGVNNEEDLFLKNEEESF